MRIMVTGHRGYIGCVMVPMLLDAGHEVIGLDTGLYEKCTYGDGIREVPWIKKDVRDVEVTDFKGIEAVLHLAGLSNDPLGDLDPELTYDINHLGSVHVAKTAKKAGVRRFIFSSSCSNYGAAGDKIIDESGDFNPVTAYGISKVRAEKDLFQLADNAFTVTCLRSATAYGVSPRLRFDLVLNNLAAWAFTTGLVHIKSDGTPWRPIVHIEDISRAFMAVLHAPKETVQAKGFNVGRTAENYQIRELADIIHEEIPNCRIEYAQDAGPDKRCYRVSCDKIAQTFSEFKPVWTAREGAKQLYKAFKENGLKLEEFEGPKYKRIDHIKQLIAGGSLEPDLRWRKG
jgi:nucleoside-diphosphate-sugar epimerase